MVVCVAVVEGWRCWHGGQGRHARTQQQQQSKERSLRPGPGNTGSMTHTKGAGDTWTGSAARLARQPGSGLQCTRMTQGCTGLRHLAPNTRNAECCFPAYTRPWVAIKSTSSSLRTCSRPHAGPPQSLLVALPTNPSSNQCQPLFRHSTSKPANKPTSPLL